jgi:hypothetical protein
MKNIFLLGVAVAVYVFLGMTPYGRLINFPVDLLCTFLHEFGHAFFCVITGGHVSSLSMSGLITHQFNPGNGMYVAGLTGTSGGNETLILMGGYAGSAIFGNLLLRLSLTRFAKFAVAGLALSMLFTSIVWFDSFTTTVTLVIAAVALLLLSVSFVAPYVLQFLGVACLIYIIKDFNVGPTGDLELYNQYVSPFPPAFVLMYLWLAIVAAITYWNVRQILRDGNEK